MKIFFSIVLLPLFLLQLLYAEKKELPNGISPSENILTNQKAQIFSLCEFLYLRPQEEGMDFAFESEDSLFVSKEKPVFNYKPAFKVALGFITHDDNWTLCFEYERLFSKENSSLFEPGKTIWASWLKYPYSYLEIEARAFSKWVLNFNLFSFDLYRSCRISQKFSLYPGIAISGLILNQKLTASYYGNLLSPEINDIIFFSKNSSKSWAIGPTVFLNGSWQLFSHFKLYAKSSGALFFQKLNVKHEESTGSIVKGLYKEEIKQVFPLLALEGGFSIGRDFKKGKYSYDFSFGYSFTDILNQNQMRALKDRLTTENDAKAGGLSLQGLILRARFDF